jgi:Holliday junction resolvase-like predicted endonuclease
LAIANAIKGLDIAATGVYRDTRGRTVIESGPLDAPIKAIGFQPQPVAAEQRRLQSKQQTIALARVVESEIAGRWAEGIFEVDADKVQKAREQLATWNRKNPSTPIRIDMTQVLRRVRDMRATKAERLLRAAPRELRGALAE